MVSAEKCKRVVAAVVVACLAAAFAATAGSSGEACGCVGRAAAFLGELKALPRQGRFFVSFTHPWHAEDDNPDSDVCRLAGKVPRMYFTDFRFVAGTWMDRAYYARCRKRLTDVVLRLYRQYGSVPVFSWHPENPFAPKGDKDVTRGAPYRYRHGVEGYPEEHRYVIAEMLSPETESAKWYERRLAEIADFLNGLKDDAGSPIPCVVRPFHECEGDWFWWGPKSVSTEDYVRIWRKTADYLRERVNGGRNLLFMFTPDRHWSEIGAPGQVRTFLWRYPGDDVVDIIGFDDYSIGADPQAEPKLAETVRKLRLLSAEAARRGKACGLSETGCKGRRDDFYDLLVRAVTAEGCRIGFVNTWSGAYTMPATDAMKEGFRRYVENPQAVFAGDYRPLGGWSLPIF
jgi:mannan endo-1,4-beta-mannosidase